MTAIAVDVGYRGKRARAAAVAFDDWRAGDATAAYTTDIAHVEAYVPGAFYRRELPCILQLLGEHDLRPDCIVIDGFVYLDGTSRPGLGLHLYEALGHVVPVIGVAKTAFIGVPRSCEIFRGTSKRPLFVTSAGMAIERARDLIGSMHGRHRLPTLLSAADRLSRLPP